MDLHIPRRATVTDDKTGLPREAVVIQAEIAGGKSLVGFRYFDGAIGACLLDEVTFAGDSDSRVTK